MSNFQYIFIASHHVIEVRLKLYRLIDDYYNGFWGKMVMLNVGLFGCYVTLKMAILNFIIVWTIDPFRNFLRGGVNLFCTDGKITKSFGIFCLKKGVWSQNKIPEYTPVMDSLNFLYKLSRKIESLPLDIT